MTSVTLFWGIASVVLVFNLSEYGIPTPSPVSLLPTTPLFQSFATPSSLAYGNPTLPHVFYFLHTRSLIQSNGNICVVIFKDSVIFLSSILTLVASARRVLPSIGVLLGC